MKLTKKIKFSIFFKFMTLAAVGITAFFSFAWFFLMPKIEKFMMDAKKEHLQNLVEMPYSILEGLNKKVESGAITLDQAQYSAKSILRTIKYDKNNYIFVFNDEKMLIHSDDTTREEKAISIFKDVNNYYYLYEAIKNCNASSKGVCFLNYMRTKPDGEVPLEKFSYVMRFKPWNYYIGTGFYVEDLKAELNSIKYAIVYVSVFATLVFFLLIFFITKYSITSPLSALTETVRSFAEGNYKVKAPTIKTKDETAELAEAFTLMQKELNLSIGALHNTAEKLKESNAKLEDTNVKLEEKVNERTKELKRAKELLEVDNEKISKLNEELQIANSSKDKFFSIIAHDLRNPLGSFKQIAELLSENLKNFSEQETDKLIKLLNVSAERTYNLLENLLEWSRAQRGLISFEPAVNNLYQIAFQAVAGAEASANNKNIELSLNIPKDLFVYADANMIYTTFRNLISNAIKFTSENGKIIVESKKFGTENDKIIVSVKDNGCGISEEIVQKLFRIDVVHTELGSGGEKGSGLGLILCKEFIEKHNGRIWVESELGKGSTFNFTLNKA